MKTIGIAKIAFASILLAILIVTTAYVIVIAQDITVSSPIGAFNWNPPPPDNFIPLSMNYPDTIGILYPGTLLNMNLNLTFSGELAENTRIQVKDVSCMATRTPPNIQMVVVGFHEAVEADMVGKSRLPGGTYAVIFNYQSYVNSTGDFFNITSANTIYFPVSGDYSPTATIYFNNGTNVQYDYSQIRIHVQAASELNAIQVSKINLGLSYALLVFSYIGLIVVFRDLLKKEKADNQFPIQIIITSDNTKLIPKNKQAKTISLTNDRLDLEKNNANLINKERTTGNSGSGQNNNSPTQ